MAKTIRIFVGEHDSFELYAMAQKERKKGTRVFINAQKLEEDVDVREVKGNNVELLGGTTSDCLPKAITFLCDVGASEIHLRAREIRLDRDDLFPDCNLELRVSTLRNCLGPKNKFVQITE